MTTKTIEELEAEKEELLLALGHCRYMLDKYGSYGQLDYGRSKAQYVIKTCAVTDKLLEKHGYLERVLKASK